MKKTILFMVTNGAGLGHLTRGLAVARRLKRIDASYEIIFLTTSLATEVIKNYGFEFYYLPARNLMAKEITPSLWNVYLLNKLQEIVNLHQPQLLVFDGAFPYSALIASINKSHEMKSIWIKRECYMNQKNELLDKEAYFDLVVVPKETSIETQVDGPKKKFCNPIILLDEEEAYDRQNLRSQWGLNSEDKLIYMQLGVSKEQESQERIRQLITNLLKEEHYHILLGENIIGPKLNIDEPRVMTIREYPNAKYFKGIDGAICAAGYNTFHELLYFGVPSLFLPNKQTGLEDQVARAKKCEVFKAGYCMENFQIEEFNQQMKYLLDHGDEIGSNAKRLVAVNGAEEAAQYVLTLT